MFLLIPYEVRTLYDRNPWGNLILLTVTVLSFVALLLDAYPGEVVSAMVLTDYSPSGLFGSLFLHAGWWHLIGNMLFLFVFGNAVCGVMNTCLYVAVYLLLGALAAAVHVIFDGHPAIGASGALCGVMGLYLAIYPLNEINCFWLFFIRGGVTGFAGWILILFWFAGDLLGAFGGNGGVAYWAHVGGTVIGFGMGMGLLKLGWIDLFEDDHPTVLGLLRGERAARAGF